MIEKFNGYNDLFASSSETLDNLLKTNNMTVKELAHKTNLDINYLNNVIEGKEEITEELANYLEELFGVSANFWLSYQSLF